MLHKMKFACNWTSTFQKYTNLHFHQTSKVLAHCSQSYPLEQDESLYLFSPWSSCFGGYTYILFFFFCLFTYFSFTTIFCSNLYIPDKMCLYITKRKFWSWLLCIFSYRVQFIHKISPCFIKINEIYHLKFTPFCPSNVSQPLNAVRFNISYNSNIPMHDTSDTQIPA